MRKNIFLTTILTLALGLNACQDAEFTEPSDSATGNPDSGQLGVASDGTFFSAPDATYLDANLEPTVANLAEYVVEDGAIKPIQVNGVYAEEAGEDADLLNSIGFGTYLNPNFGAEATEWSDLDAFTSVLKATVTLETAGDSVKFCRSFATTCITAVLGSSAATTGIQLTSAANLPDTELGAIGTIEDVAENDVNVMAAIRGTGDDGLTIALADTSSVFFPSSAITAGTSFELEWTVSRGDEVDSLISGFTVGSLDWSISINGTVLEESNTNSDISTNAVKDLGVVLQYTGDEDAIDAATDAGNGHGSDYHVNLHTDPATGAAFAPVYVWLDAHPGINDLSFSSFPGWFNYDQSSGTDYVINSDDAIVGASYGIGECGDAPNYPVNPDPDCDDRTVSVFSVAFDDGTNSQTGTGGMYLPPSLVYAGAFGDVFEGAITQAATTMITNNFGGATSINTQANCSAFINAAGDDTSSALKTNLEAAGVTSNYCTATGDSTKDAIIGQAAGYFLKASWTGALEGTFAGAQAENKAAIITEATLDGTIDTVAVDGADSETPPAQEIAEIGGSQISVSAFVPQLFGGFVAEAYGATVPASNFSMSMNNGDSTGAAAPSVSGLMISNK